MARRFIATILAAALAVTTLGAPAQAASNEDLVKLLAGATALVIIGKAIKDSKDRRRETVTRHDPRWDRDRHGGRWERDRHGRHGRHDRHGRRDDRHDRGYHRGHGWVMPSQCRVTVATDAGNLSGYDYRCVQSNARFAASLPGECVTAARTRRGPQFIYTSHCLQRSGIRAF